MAKIADLKFNLNGKDFSVPVNCTSDGMFNTTLPDEIWRALDLKPKLKAKTKAEITTEFFSALDRYRKAETKQELLIAIRYMSAGRFNEKENGHALFSNTDRKYKLNISWEYEEIDALAFGFHVTIKETIDTVTKYYLAELGENMHTWSDEKPKTKGKFYKSGSFTGVDKWKFIPYSEQAFNTLKIAQEKIRTVSEMLFNFIEQDEEKMLLSLTQNRLLTNKQ